MKAFLLFLLFWAFHSNGQRTVGLLKYSDKASEGYTLFSPIQSKETYLIDLCGYVVHSWKAKEFPGQTAYLMPNGDLLRTARIGGAFTGGGVGGKVEIYSWEGDLKWSHVFATLSTHQHHVAKPLPNGNFITILWKKYSKTEAIQKGFNPMTLTEAGIWSDKIIEVKPLANNEAEIVWEWDFWDHTIQDLDPTKSDFGNVKDHSELLDVNFSEDPGSNPAEWLHANSLDYHPEYDQILVSSKYHHEFYIIDHSTTKDEAKSHQGGRYGKGGDFLYRWGNPAAYRQGTDNNHILYGQHDVQWIPKGLPGENQILCFNNGSTRTPELFSTVDQILPPVNQDGSYKIDPQQPYGPDRPFWTYEANPRSDFYSARLSGVQRLSNGNSLICEANKGNFFEVTMEGKIVWQYKNPVNIFGPATQGTIPSGNDVFNITRYGPDDPAFTDKVLIGNTTLEVNNSPYVCDSVSILHDFNDIESSIYPNPTQNHLFVEDVSDRKMLFTIYDLTGKVIEEGSLISGMVELNKLKAGTFILRIHDLQSNKITNFVFQKL